MTNVRPLVPRVTVNRRFVHALMSQERACCALGLIEVRKEVFGLLALRPEPPVSSAASADGFELGHQLLVARGGEVVRLSFEFRNAATYHVLLNPSSAVVQQVLGKMLDTGDYFVLVVNANGGASAFRSGFGDDSLSGIRQWWPRLQRSTTTEEQYRVAVEQFCRDRAVQGHLLEWTGRDDLSLLDMANDRMEIRPA